MTLRVVRVVRDGGLHSLKTWGGRKPASSLHLVRVWGFCAPNFFFLGTAYAP